MREPFPLPYAILDIWRTHRCDISTRAYSGLCIHNFNDRQTRERAKETETMDHEMCLSDGLEAIVEKPWEILFMNVVKVTSSYPHADEPSAYKFCGTRAEENALAAVGYYFQIRSRKINGFK